jgi:hypothetical protein
LWDLLVVDPIFRLEHPEVDFRLAATDDLEGDWDCLLLSRLKSAEHETALDAIKRSALISEYIFGSGLPARLWA